MSEEISQHRDISPLRLHKALAEEVPQRMRVADLRWQAVHPAIVVKLGLNSPYSIRLVRCTPEDVSLSLPDAIEVVLDIPAQPFGDEYDAVYPALGI